MSTTKDVLHEVAEERIRLSINGPTDLKSLINKFTELGTFVYEVIAIDYIALRSFRRALIGMAAVIIQIIEKLDS